jgi:hypothetical protein
MVFDPDQDPEEKRGVRKSYRLLTKKIEGACSPDIPHLYEVYFFLQQIIKEIPMNSLRRSFSHKYIKQTNYSIKAGSIV